MNCSVWGCKNHSKKGCKHWKEGVYFFKFPKDPLLIKDWLYFCKRKDVEPSTARICSEHFREEDCSKDLQYEMGFRDRRRLFLKPGTVPVYKHRVEKNLAISRTNRKKDKEHKKFIESILNPPSPLKDELESTGTSEIELKREKQTDVTSLNPSEEDDKNCISMEDDITNSSTATDKIIFCPPDFKFDANDDMQEIEFLEESTNISPTEFAMDTITCGRSSSVEDTMNTLNSAIEEIDNPSIIWEVEELYEEDNDNETNFSTVPVINHVQFDQDQTPEEQKRGCIKEVTENQEEICRLKVNEESLLNKIELLEYKLEKRKLLTTNLENMLASIFTSGQIRNLRNESSPMKWSREDIFNCIKLYSVSPEAYHYLKRKKFSLPSVSTMQRLSKDKTHRIDEVIS